VRQSRRGITKEWQASFSDLFNMAVIGAAAPAHDVQV
jgi:hypothetical protein